MQVKGQVAGIVVDQLRMFGLILVDPVLDLMPVMLYESLNRPGSSIPQRTNSVSFDLLR